MPELPEVETIVNDLRPALVGQTIRGATFNWTGSIAVPSPEEFARRIKGKRVEGVSRRGKHILISLSGDDVLIVHLRMSGRLVVAGRDEAEARFQRLALQMEDGKELRFADLRKFGRLWLLPKEAAEAKLDAKLGIEPLGDAFTLKSFSDLVRSTRMRVKSLLLDQSRIAGIGNIYADEALFAAGIHPHRSADSLSDGEISRLHKALRSLLRDSIGNRGTTFRDYRDAFGVPGEHQEQLLVYRRTGEPCPRCGTPIVRARFGGRGTHYCPKCQPEDLGA